MGERIDVVLYGVTGLVGRYGVRHLHKLAAEKSLKWGIGGRDEIKIRKVIEKLQEETGDKSLASIPIFIADLTDEKSLKLMTSRTRVLINACGPLNSIGESIIKVCIQTKTHYVDVSAEEIFLIDMLLKYDKKAEAAGVYIANACGVNCLTYDLGLLHLQDIFPGTLNSVEIYLKGGVDDPTLTGPSYNQSTWRSSIELALRKRELTSLKKKLPPLKLPKLKPALSARKIPFKPDVEDGRAVLFTNTDHYVLTKTQSELYEEKNIRPTQINNYLVATSLYYFVVFIFLGLLFVILLPFESGRKLLLRYPSFFSNGLFDTTEPSSEVCKSSWCRITMVGRGWKGKTLKANDQCHEKPNHEMIMQLKLQDPAYNITSICLILAGIVMASETHNLPKRHGVRTPGMLFKDTSLRKQLEENGCKYEIISESNI